jgi:YD repeat-containing protein
VYTYDDANRLTGVTDGVSAVSYTYNGLGDRLQTNAGAASD